MPKRSERLVSKTLFRSVYNSMYMKEIKNRFEDVGHLELNIFPFAFFFFCLHIICSPIICINVLTLTTMSYFINSQTQSSIKYSAYCYLVFSMHKHISLASRLRKILHLKTKQNKRGSGGARGKFLLI